MRYRNPLFIGLFLAVSLPVHAYNVYKCKDNNGNIVFSQTLCLDTESEFVQVEPATGDDAAPGRYKTLTERANKNTHFQKNTNSSPKNTSKVIRSRKKSESGDSALCMKYKNRVAKTQADMRSGYTSKQGEYLRSRFREEKKKLGQYCK